MGPILKTVNLADTEFVFDDPQIPKTTGFCRFGSPAEHSAPKGRSLADIGEILVIWDALKTRRLCLRCYGSR